MSRHVHWPFRTFHALRSPIHIYTHHPAATRNIYLGCPLYARHVPSKCNRLSARAIDPMPETKTHYIHYTKTRSHRPHYNSMFVGIPKTISYEEDRTNRIHVFACMMWKECVEYIWCIDRLFVCTMYICKR